MASPALHFHYVPESEVLRSRRIGRIAVHRDLLAVGRMDMSVTIERGGETLHRFDLRSRNDKVRPTERIRTLAFSPDGETLYMAAGEQILAIETATGRERWSYVPPRSFGFLVVSPVNLSVSSDGQIGASFDNGTFGVWRPTGEIRWLWHNNDSPRMMEFSADGQKLIGTDSFSLCAWRSDARRLCRRLRMPDRVYGMAVGSNLVTAVRTLHSVLVYDMADGALVGQMAIRDGLPLIRHVSPVDAFAVTEERAVSLHRPDGGFVRRIEVPSAIISMAVSTETNEILLGTADEELTRISI